MENQAFLLHRGGQRPYDGDRLTDVHGQKDRCEDGCAKNQSCTDVVKASRGSGCYPRGGNEVVATDGQSPRKSDAYVFVCQACSVGGGVLRAISPEGALPSPSGFNAPS